MRLCSKTRAQNSTTVAELVEIIRPADGVGMAVGRAYGMIDDSAVDSAAVRSTYFIDPEGVVRAITTYPHNVGRSVSEMLRLVRALQVTEDGEALAPEGWQPGDRLLALPMINSTEIEAEDDWFCHLADAK